MKNKFFSSDYHFDHENVIRFCNRPFSSVEEMNETIIARHNEIVKPEDEFWFIGDFAFSKTLEKKLEYLKRLNGVKYFVSGNHDKLRDYLCFTKELRAAGVSCTFFWRMVELEGGDWKPYYPTLSHFPMLSWNRSTHGAFNLHGHTHGNLPEDPLARRMDVGVDSHNFYPVAWEDIVQKLSKIPTPKELYTNVSSGTDSSPDPKPQATPGVYTPPATSY